MLNPSTADAREDDATIRRCTAFARAWGFGGLVVVNLYAWRATDPAQLKVAADPVGPGADDMLLDGLSQVQQLVVAWGAHGGLPRVAHVGRLVASCTHLEAVVCLGRTKGGQPRHPLYLAASTPREAYVFPSALHVAR
jgi:hypothetical protein